MLSEVASKSTLNDVRNMSAFLMGIIKKHSALGNRDRERDRDRGRAAFDFRDNGPGMGFGHRGDQQPHMFGGPGFDMQMNGMPGGGMPGGGMPMGQPFNGPMAPAGLPPPVGKPVREHHGLTHVQWGVRVDEFHGLSVFAQYVHPAPALKLQQLWDSGNRLVSLLNDRFACDFSCPGLTFVKIQKAGLQLPCGSHQKPYTSVPMWVHAVQVLGGPG